MHEKLSYKPQVSKNKQTENVNIDCSVMMLPLLLKMSDQLCLCSELCVASVDPKSGWESFRPPPNPSAPSAPHLTFNIAPHNINRPQANTVFTRAECSQTAQWVCVCVGAHRASLSLRASLTQQALFFKKLSTLVCLCQKRDCDQFARSYCTMLQQFGNQLCF